MQLVEKRSPAPPRPATPNPAPANVSVSAPARTSSPNRPIPTPFPGRQASYKLEDFVGWTTGGEKPEAKIKVNRQNAGLLTDHSLANLNLNGLFIPAERPYPLGTMMKICLTFEGQKREVTAQGKVIWENAGAIRKYVTGMGVRLMDLSDDDKTFIRGFLAAIPPEGRTFLRF
jgi:uncharacterized protein (TIGR02266 family)